MHPFSRDHAEPPTSPSRQSGRLTLSPGGSSSDDTWMLYAMKHSTAPIHSSIENPLNINRQNFTHSGVVLGGVSWLGPSRSSTSRAACVDKPCNDRECAHGTVAPAAMRTWLAEQETAFLKQPTHPRLNRPAPYGVRHTGTAGDSRTSAAPAKRVTHRNRTREHDSTMRNHLR